MVILTIYYLDILNTECSYDTDPLDIGAVMDRVMRFCQSGADVIRHHDTGEMEVLLMHRVLGMTIRPTQPN